MGRGKTIQIFLPDGSANGIKLAEITSAIEKAILIPRNNLQEATKRKETAQEGIYFLFGVDDEKAKPLVYIGQTKEGIKRIKNHDQNKDFWNYALLIISKTKSFTKTHIEFLEELVNSYLLKYSDIRLILKLSSTLICFENIKSSI